jgi:nonribosomal peptide synthetase protein BlmVIII
MPAGVPAEPGHWARHLRQPVLFDQGIRQLLEAGDTVLVEVGPSGTLSSLAARHPQRRPGHLVITTQPHATGPGGQHEALLAAVGQAWAAGCLPDPAALFAGGQHLKTDCPLYPFARERHWVDPPAVTAAPAAYPLARLAHEARQRIKELETEQPVRGIGCYPELAHRLDGLCAAVALQYLSRAGLDTRPGARHDWASLGRQLGVLPQYQRYLDYLLRILSDDGIAARESDGIRFLHGGLRADPEHLAADLSRGHPGFAGLAELLMHCGSRLGEALTQPGAALGVLYPGGEGELLRRTLGTGTVEFSVTARLARLVATMTAKLADQVPGRQLRVLEIGAGSGRLTGELAAVLRSRPAEFTVTDISPLFLRRLRDQAQRDGARIRTSVLDISRDASGQGFAGQQFDLIAGLDVLHVAPDIPAALARLRSMLAPGGVIAMVETVAQDRWLSLVWGLSDEWWAFSDAVRERTPLLPAEQWAALMAAQDFTDAAVLPGDSDPGSADAALILAQAPGQQDAAATAPSALPDLPGKRPDLATWSYLAGWRRGAPAARPDGRLTGAVCLAFTEAGTGDAVLAGLRGRGLTVLTVMPGAASSALAQSPGSGAWTLAPDRPGDYPLLLDQVIREHGLPGFVLHLWNMRPGQEGQLLDQAEQAQQRGLFSLIPLVRALADRAATRPVRLLAVTSEAQDVLGGELLAPERSTVHAAVKVIGVEYPHISSSSLDVPAAAAGTPGAARIADHIADELLSEPENAVVAYRGRSRWLPSYTACALPPAAGQLGSAVPGGVYLICGGLGGIGLSLAHYLGRLPARLVLLRRTPFPDRAEWASWLAGHPDNDRTSAAIRRLLDVEAAGGQALILQADVTSLPAMRAAVTQAAERFGPITGVIHAAGVRDTAGVIQRRSLAATWSAISAKVLGTLVLEEALRGHQPRFIVLCSSIGTVLHKLKFGEVGYVAGNEFLNAWAASRTGPGRPVTVAISWTDWLDAGMWADSRDQLAGRYVVAPGDGYDPGIDLLRGISTAEGVEVFRRVLAQRAGPHVVISTQDLDALLAQQAAFSHADRARVLESLRPAGAAGRAEPAPQPGAAPRTGQERAVAAIWASVLGLPEIGVQDDFFALGGDSLLALRLLARMRQDTGVDRTIADLFKAPTIAGLLTAGSPDAVGTPAGPQEVVIL